MGRLSEKKRVLFITDPWDTLDHAGDTSIRLIEEAELLGADVFWSEIRELGLANNRVEIQSRRFKDLKRKTSGLMVKVPTDFDQIHYRVDPPVNETYIAGLQLLLEHPGVVNPAAFILNHSEKLASLKLGLGKLTPESWILHRYSDLASLLKKYPQVVLKPLYSAQSKGVELVDTKNASAGFQSVSEKGTRPILAQQFLKSIEEDGETRLWFLDGELLAHCTKMPARGTFKIDMDQGGTIKFEALSPSQKAAAKEIGTALKKHKVRLAAVDLISSLITDLNFTSPGLLKQMEALKGENLAKIIMQKLLK